MKRRLALVAFIGLVSLLGATACGPEKYGLFGEFSEEGATVRSESTFAIDAAELSIETPIGDMTGAMSMNQRSVSATSSSRLCARANSGWRWLRRWPIWAVGSWTSMTTA